TLAREREKALCSVVHLTCLGLLCATIVSLVLPSLSWLFRCDVDLLGLANNGACSLQESWGVDRLACHATNHHRGATSRQQSTVVYGSATPATQQQQQLVRFTLRFLPLRLHVVSACDCLGG
ncbi:unnamed protein product, partial [Ectocarpus sp. 12 AP-2014]